MANEKRLIDANEALEVLCNYCDVEGCCPEGGCTEFQKISKLPTVEAVEVVHARWEMGLDEGDYEYGTCSVCGYNEYNAFGCCLPHNYCPNCGAKMDGGNEDG